MAVSDYSMFDVQKEKEEQRHKTAYEAAQVPRGRMPIYASFVGGDLYNEGLMGLAGMLGGTPDPATAKQQAILEIQERFPNPDTFEEFMELANAFSMAGFYSFAEAAIKAANDTRASMPTPLTSKEKAFEIFLQTPEFLSGEVDVFDFEEDWTAATTAPSTPKTQTAEEIDLAEFLVSPEYQSGKKTVADWQLAWNKATSAGTSQKYSTTEVKTEDKITGEDILETWRVDPDGQITDTEPLFTQRKDADGGSTGIGLALNILQDVPEFQTALANNDSATINRMIKETTEAITPDEKKDRTWLKVGDVWRYTDGEQEKVFSDQDIPEDPDAKAEEIYAKYLVDHPELFNTPEGNIRLAKDLVGAKLTSTKIFSDLMGSVGQDGQNAIRQEELTVRAMERLSDNYVDSGVGGMDSLLAPIEASIAANMKQVVNKDGQVVWEGQLPGWDLTSSLDKWLPGSKGYAARQFAGQAASLINTVLRQRSGAAVTSHEWDRLVQEFTGGRIKTSAQFANWVGRMRDYNEKTKGYIMAGYEPVVQNRFMANMGSYMTIDPETELNLVPMGGWFISSTDGKVYRRDK